MPTLIFKTNTVCLRLYTAYHYHLKLIVPLSMLYHKQELSYRKQIARRLRTQYVEGIYRPNYHVTLKYKLRVTQDQWKRNL